MFELWRNPLFDSAWYKEAYPDVAAAGVNPFWHYLRFGRKEGRSAVPLRAISLDQALWQGEDAAAAELSTLLDHRNPRERTVAAWALGRWHGSLRRWDEAAELMRLFWRERRALAWVPNLGPDLLTISAMAWTGRYQQARGQLALARDRHGDNVSLALAAILAEPPDARDEVVQGHLRRAYLASGLAAPKLAGESRPRFDRLTLDQAAATDGPLVSVIVPSYDAERTLDTALASLVAQSWRNLEIIVVDDCSTDATFLIAQRWQQRDSRVRARRLPRHDGAYVARNAGLAEASGAFFTVHDADDWSHRDKIRLQVEALLADSAPAASLSYWVRVDDDLRHSHSLRPQLCYVNPNTSSLMFRAAVRERLGFWDRVQVNADSEYYFRLVRVYGQASVLHVLPETPLAFGRSRPDSLTRQPRTHLRTLLRGVRHDYQEAFRQWHRAADDEALYLPQFPSRRPFPVPAEIGVGDPEAA